MNDHQNGHPPEPAPEGAIVVLLPDDYRRALLGNHVSPLEPPRAVYSLPLLSQIEAKRLHTDEETAQKSVISMMRAIYQDHGNRAPIFVDDAIRRSKPREKKDKRIITPDQWRR